MAKIYIDNIEAIERAWKLAPKLMERELKTALQNSLLRVEARAVREAPVDTGNLAGKITTSLFDLVGRVHTSDGGKQVKYLKWVHEGRDEITAAPGKVLAARVEDLSVGQRSKFAGRVNKKGYIVFGKRVRRQKPNRFFDRAAEQTERSINIEFDNAVKRVLRSIGKTKYEL